MGDGGGDVRLPVANGRWGGAPRSSARASTTTPGAPLYQSARLTALQQVRRASSRRQQQQQQVPQSSNRRSNITVPYRQSRPL